MKGKFNVEKAMQHKVFENQEIINIYTALGVSVGNEDDSKALNLEKRYHKQSSCVMNVDGSHISTLILTFSSDTCELIENGHVYIATPPLLSKGLKNNTLGMIRIVINLLKISVLVLQCKDIKAL